MLYAMDTTAITGLPAHLPSPQDQIFIPPFLGANIWSAVKACLRPSSNISALGLGACLRPLMEKDIETTRANDTLIDSDNTARGYVQTTMALDAFHSPAESSQIFRHPLTPTRPKVWTPTFLDPEDAPSDDMDDDISDAATNLWSRPSAHSSTTSLGDDLEYATPYLLCKKIVSASRPLTVESMNILDAAATQGAFGTKESCVRSWIDAHPSQHCIIAEFGSELGGTASTSGDDDDDSEDGWEEWDRQMEEILVGEGECVLDESSIVPIVPTATATFSCTTNVPSVFNVTSVWQDFEIARSPSSTTSTIATATSCAIQDNAVVKVNQQMTDIDGVLCGEKNDDPKEWDRLMVETEPDEDLGEKSSASSRVDYFTVAFIMSPFPAHDADITFNITKDTPVIIDKREHGRTVLVECKKNEETVENISMVENMADENDERDVCDLLFEDEVVSYSQERILEVNNDEFEVEDILMGEKFQLSNYVSKLDIQDSVLPSVIGSSTVSMIAESGLDNNDISVPVPERDLSVNQEMAAFCSAAELILALDIRGDADEEEIVKKELWPGVSNAVDDDDYALHHSPSEYYPSTQHYGDRSVSIDTDRATDDGGARTASVFDYFSHTVLGFLAILACVYQTMSTSLPWAASLLSAVMAVVRPLVKVSAFLLFMIWCILALGMCTPSGPCGWGRSLLVAT